MNPGKMLNRRVAIKVMGWPIEGDRWKGYAHGVGDDRPTVYADNWRPSEDISHAMMVLDKININFTLKRSSDCCYHVVLGPVDAIGQTAAHAICLAALKYTELQRGQ